MKRYLTNEGSGEVLVFPDVLKLKLQSEASQGAEITLVYDANMEADPRLLDKFKSARQVALSNPFFVLRKPVSIWTSDFQFVPLGALAGRAVLTVNVAVVDQAKSEIASNAKFFDPEYSGTSEPFLASMEVAGSALSDLEVEHIRSRSGIVRQIEALLQAIRRDVDSSDIEHAASLAELVVSDGNIVRNGSGWHLALEPGQKTTSLTEVRETVRRISGDAENIQLG